MSKVTRLISILTKLTKHEKRYITIEINRRKKYEKSVHAVADLFQSLATPDFQDKLIEKETALRTKAARNAEKYTPKALERQLKKWVIEDYLAKEKKIRVKSASVNALHDLIFESLRQYNAEDPEFRLDRYIQDIRILLQKNLYQDALLIVDKAKEEALTTYEFHLKALELIFQERTLRLSIGGKTNWSELDELNDLCVQQTKHLENLCAVLKDRELLARKYRTGTKNVALTSLSKVTRDIVKDIQVADSYPFEVKFQSLHQAAKYYYHFNFDDKENAREVVEKALPYTTKLYELFAHNPRYQAFRPDRFRQAKQTHLTVSLWAGRLEEETNIISHDEAELGMLWETDNKNLTIENRLNSEVEFRTLLGILAYYLHTRNYGRIQAIMRATTKWLQESKVRIDVRYFIYHHYLLVSLLLEDWSAVDNNLMQINRMQNITNRTDYVWIEMLSVLAAFEKRHTEPGELEIDMTNLIQKYSHLESKDGKIANLILTHLTTVTSSEKLYKSAKTGEEDIAKNELDILQRLAQHLHHIDTTGTSFSSFKFWLEKKLSNKE